MTHCLNGTRLLLFLFLVAISPLFSSSVWSDVIDQSAIESGFIYQFTHYIHWPGSPPDTRSPFLIQVVGESQVTGALKKLAQVKTIQGRSIQVKEVSSSSELEPGEIIFVASTDPNILASVVKKTKGFHALIISHSEGFAKQGAMINLFIENDRMRFEINVNSLKWEGLQASSQLLKLARIVE